MYCCEVEMKWIAGLLLGASLLLSLAHAKEWTWEYKPLKASYSIYSGELGERQAPSATDRKLAVEITGQAAKEMFDSMPPDFHPSCSQAKGDRDRRKGKVYCTVHSGEGYRCFIGINLRTGESISGATC
jgi:hypothetical protein